MMATGIAQAAPDLGYTVQATHPESHQYSVVFRLSGIEGTVVDLRMPGWMPGYYQILDYAAALSGFGAKDGQGRPLAWEQTDHSSWRVAVPEIFDYVYTVKEPEYGKYLGYGGMGIEAGPGFRIVLLPNPDGLQLSIRKSFLGN